MTVEVWKCLGEMALEFLTKLYNITMESDRMPEEWRDRIMIPIFKNNAYDELYEELDSKEGERTLYRLARQRHQAGKDVQQVRMMKDKDGKVMTDEESVLRIWTDE